MTADSAEKRLIAAAPSGWFARQPAGFRRRLLEQSVEMSFLDGDWLYGTEDEAGGLFGILSGSVHLTAAVADEGSALIDLAGPGKWFGQIGLLPGTQRLVTAAADGPVKALAVPRSSLTRFVADFPDAWLSFSALNLELIQDTVRTLADVLALPPSPRVAARLHALASRGAEAQGRHVRLTQSQLGDMTGLERKSVHRILQALQKRGLIRLHYAAIEVLDLRGLARAAAFGN
jgi:CRP-like cAMP-binding protein